MTACATCGVDNDAAATFCEACHQFLAWDARPVATQSPPVVAHDPATDVLGSVELGEQLARASGRDDLAERMQRVRAAVADTIVSVAVVGEFKRGKSTLVNALLQTAVCPVDADMVTAVPTAVRYGEQAAASAVLEPNGDAAPAVEDVPIESLASYVSEDGNAGNQRRLRMVEVSLPRPILRSGLCLVDTPGVGGLDSAQGVITRSTVARAQGVLFLTDASQELTAPEITFLRAAVERCPNAACVVTKIDLYMHWRRIVEIDEQHLRAAGLDVPVFAVSSFLRLAAGTDPELLGESGFPALVDFLLGRLVPAGTTAEVHAANKEIEFVADQLEQVLQSERDVLEDLGRSAEVVRRLDRAVDDARALAGPAATWQQMLTDGMQDLVADVEFDLQERLRTVMRDAEAVVDEGDPKQTWPDIEVWLRRQAVAAAVDNYEHMQRRARDLADDVAGAFDLVATRFAGSRTSSADDALAAIRLADAATLENPAGRVASMLVAGRTATLVPMLLVGALGHLLLPVVAPIALVLAAGIGQKVIRDERHRQVAYRRQQAKNAARRYVDEVAFMVSKDSRDALRATQRALRDGFRQRAEVLQVSADANAHAAREARDLPPDRRAARVGALAEKVAAVDELRTRPASAPARSAVARG